MKARFRAWNPEVKKMYYPDWVENSEDGLVAGTGWEMWNVAHDDHPVMMSTGREDMSIQDIYIGDVLECETGRERFLGSVVWDNGIFFQKWISKNCQQNLPMGFLDRYVHKVIGNIYEDPELLK